MSLHASILCTLHPKLAGLPTVASESLTGAIILYPLSPLNPSSTVGHQLYMGYTSVSVSDSVIMTSYSAVVYTSFNLESRSVVAMRDWYRRCV